MLYLSKHDLAQLDCPAEAVLSVLEQTILSADPQSHHPSTWAVPKSVLTLPDGRYLMTTMSVSDNPPLMAVKSLLVNQHNPRQGLDAINASITLLNSQTGLTEAMLDGNWVTAIRTAAASALAARKLARSDSTHIAFIGCGVQAQSHLALFKQLFPLRHVFALGRGAKNRDALCHTALELGLNATPCDDAKQAVELADIVISSIPLNYSGEAFIDPNWLKPGVFVSSVDLGLPWMKQGLENFSCTIVDDLAQEAAMATPLLPVNLVHGDITDLVSGRLAGRTDAAQKTGFFFRAVALGDFALATLAYRLARSQQLGTELPA